MGRPLLLGSSLAAVALGSLLAGAALADQVIADDAIVQGSLCIGFDCVNGEVFASTLIRLKENNTRIKLEDTSDALLGPSADWGVTANDSPSGGVDRFSIDDATALTSPFWVSGAAPDASLYVAASGQVGVGTDAPEAGHRLHVAGSMRIDGDLIVTAGARSGRVPASEFLDDRSATVTFAVPYAREYAIVLTPVAADPKARATVSLITRDANGFTFTISGKPSQLSEVAWATRWVGEF